MSGHLQYGDFITIHSFFEEDDERLEGSLSAKGHFDDKVYFQTHPPRSEKDEGRSYVISNYRDFVFQVWPLISFEASKQLNKRKKELVLKSRGIETLLPEAKKKKLEELDELKSEYEECQKRLVKEVEYNTKTFNLNFGYDLTYGTDILLQHVDSQMFLNGRIVTSEADKSAFKFELSEKLNSGMVFRLTPKFKLRQNGESVQYTDQMLIFNVKLNCYINYSKDSPIPFDRELAKDEKAQAFTPYYKAIRTKRIDGFSDRYEAFLSQSPEFHWELKPHGREDKNPEVRSKNKFIRGGELIRLRNRETSADLTATINFTAENAELFLRRYSGSYEKERETVNSLFEIELAEKEQVRGGDCVFIDEKSAEAPTFRLRHFITGYLLGFQEINRRKVPVLINGSSSEAKDKSVFELRFLPTVSKDVNVLRNGGTYQIEFQGGLMMKPDDSRAFKREKVIKIDSSEQVFEPLRDDEMFLERVPLQLEKGMSEEHAFQIIKIFEAEKTLLLKLASAVQFLTYLRDIFRHQIQEEQFNDVCKKAINMLTRLIFFMIKRDESSEEGFSELNPNRAIECEGIPNPEHQNIFKDMKFIEIVVDLLYIPFRNKMYDLQDLSDLSPDMIMIFTLSYRLIKFSIKEYRPNELYASQWLGLFMIQTLYADPNVDFLAEPTLTELIDNNRIVLEKIKNEIKQFVDLMKKNPVKKFVKLLKAVCVCDGEPMLKNQQSISQQMFQDEETRLHILLPLRELPKQTIEVRIKGDFINLEQFQQKDSPELEYFLALIELFADLCLKKNFIAIDGLKETYTFQLCFLIVSNERYKPEVRSAFMRLITSLWVEAKGEILPTLSSIRTWEQINSNEVQLICMREPLGQFDQLKKFMRDYLAKVAEQGYMKGFEQEKNVLTLEILELVKMMTVSGFFQTVDEINEIMPSLLSILNSAHDVTTKSEDETIEPIVAALRKKNRDLMSPKRKKTAKKGLKAERTRFKSRYREDEQTLIMMHCKQTVCDVVKVFFDLRTDLRLTLFMQEFRKEFSTLAQLTNENNQQQEDNGNNQTLSAIFKTSKRLLKKIALQEEENSLKKANYDALTYYENPMVWAQKIVATKSIKIQDSTSIDMTSMLLDLTLYENSQLVNKAFELLYKLNSQNRSIFEAVREVQLLETPELVKAFQEIKGLRESLRGLTETSEVWFFKKNDESHREYMALLTRMNGLLDLKVEKVNDLKRVQEPEDEDVPGSKKLLLEEELEEHMLSKNDTSLLLNYSVNRDRQELMRNLNVADYVISLLKYDLEFQEKEENNTNLQMIKLSYKFLAAYCHNNAKNQASIEGHLNSFVEHLRGVPRSDAHLLIIELFNNNKRLLFDAEKIDEVFDIFCSTLESTDNLTIKEYLMNSLQTFLKFKSSAVKINQTKLISKIGANTYRNILRTFKSEEEIEDFIIKVNRFQEIIEEKSLNGVSAVLDLPLEIAYFSQQMLILSLVSEEKNYAAESRCQVFFPLETLRKILDGSKGMWYLRKYFVFFFFNVFLETEKEVNETAKLIDSIIDILIEDLKLLGERIDESTKVEIRTVRGSTSLFFTQIDYLIVSLLPCLTIIMKHQLMSSDKTIDYYRRCIENLLILAPKVLTHTEAKTSLSNFLALILKKKKILEQLQFDKSYRQLIPAALVRERKATNFNYKKSYTHKAVDKLQGSDIEGISKSEKFHKRIEMSIKSKRFNEITEEEFTSLVNNIVNIEEITKETYRGYCTIGFEELSKSLLSLIDPTDLVLTDELTIVGIKVFRKIIERENRDVLTCAAEWSTSEYAENSKKIEFRQNQLCDLGVVEVIGNMIGNGQLSRELKNEAILLGISMLVGGNSKVQDRFFKYMSSGTDEQNNLLMNLKHMIDEDFQRIRKAMYVKNANYESHVLELQAERAESMNQESLAKIQSGTMIQSVLDLKQINEEEQRLLEKERDEDERKGRSLKKVFEEGEPDDEIDNEEEEIIVKIVTLTRIYQLLRLFCEGHNQDMQDQLRLQLIQKRVSGKTCNFISNTSYKFGAMVKFVNVHCTKLFNIMIDFLIEAIQGPCVNNQLELKNAKIPEFVKDLLNSYKIPNEYYKRGFINPEEQEEINIIVTKSSNLLISLVEGNTTDDILKDLCSRLDFSFMRAILAKEYVSFLRNTLGLEEPFPPFDEVNEMIKFKLYEGNIAQAFNVFILIKTIAMNIKSEDPDSKNVAAYALEYDADDTTPEVHNALDFFDSNVVSIEIFFHDKLHRIFFPIEPVCRNLSKETRVNLMQTVKRDSPSEKIMGLLTASPDLFDEMEHMTDLKTWRIEFTASRLSFFHDLSTLLALFLNILMLATFYRRIETEKGQTDFSTASTVIAAGGVEGSEDGANVDALLTAFGLTQVATSGLMLIYWIVLYSKLSIKRRWREFVKVNKQKLWDQKMEDEIEEMENFDIETLDLKHAQYLMMVKGPESKYFITKGKRNFGSEFLKFSYYIKSAVMLMSEPGLIYAIFYIVVSLFGLLVSPLFYSYHLLDIISRFETLKNVIRSVTRNANQLLLTLVLGLIILYMFTILMFFFLFDAYWNGGITPDGASTSGELMCSTMFQCYLSTINMGLRSGGGFGDKTTDESYGWDNRGRYYLSFFIKICSFSSINIIFLNIIFGIIIDTFAELRDEKNRIDTDMKNICFICGLDRYDFEKTGEGFDAHIDRDHRLWNYLYYIYYIRTKDETDYSGIESTIASSLEKDDTFWFPMMKAMVLGEGEKKVMAGELINERVGLLRSKIEEISSAYEQKVKSLKKKK